MIRFTPRVTVVIACYQYGHVLPDALDSLLAQTYTDWECLIIDDGSTDSTADVAQRYVRSDGRFSYHRQENRGVSAARNVGLRSASGELVQLLDADDRLVPSKLAGQVKYLEEHPATDIVFGNVAYFRSQQPQAILSSPGGLLSRPIMDDRIHGAAEALLKLEHFNFMHLASALIRRRVFQDTGLFNEQITRASVEDWDLWLRMAIGGYRFDHWDKDEPVALIRVHAGSATNTRGRILNGLMEAAKTFGQSQASLKWRRDRLPLIYEMAAGAELAREGRRSAGARRIWLAAGEARESLTALRWRVYAAAALLLPRRMFMQVVSMPIPESLFEIYRRIKRMMHRRPT